MDAHPAGHVRLRAAAVRRLRLAALALLLAAAAGGAAAHEVHVSTARVALEPQAAYVRVRLFRRDFEQALRAHAGRADFRLLADPHADSVVTSYVARHLVLRNDGATLDATLLGSGEERGAKPELDIWWVDFRYRAASELRELEITNELLFERFRDQANTMRFRLPDGEEKTVTFVRGEGTYRFRL